MIAITDCSASNKWQTALHNVTAALGIYVHIVCMYLHSYIQSGVGGAVVFDYPSACIASIIQKKWSQIQIWRHRNHLQICTCCMSMSISMSMYMYICILYIYCMTKSVAFVNWHSHVATWTMGWMVFTRGCNADAIQKKNKPSLRCQLWKVWPVPSSRFAVSYLLPWCVYVYMWWANKYRV